MPTNREIRALKKIEMAKRREKKKRKKELREQGFVDFEGEIIPLTEARRRWGQKGAVHGIKGAVHGIKGAKHGVKGSTHGVKGSTHGVKGSTHRVKRSSHGVKGASHGVKVGSHRVQGTTYGVKLESHGVKMETLWVKEESHVVKVESHEVKAESHEIKGATHEVKGESHGVKVELHWVKGESHEIKEESHGVKGESHGLIGSFNGKEKDIEGNHQFKKINRLGSTSKKFKSNKKVRKHKGMEEKFKVCKEEVTTPGVTGWFGCSGAADKLIYIKKEATESVDENGSKKEDFEISKNSEAFSTTSFRLLQCKSLSKGFGMNVASSFESQDKFNSSMNGLFHESESNDVKNGHYNDIEEAEKTFKTGKDEMKEVQPMEVGDENEIIDKNALSAKSGKENEDMRLEESLLNEDESNDNSKGKNLENEEENDNDDSDALGMTCEKDADISEKVSEENINTGISNTNSAEIAELNKDKTDNHNLGKEDADINRNDGIEDKKSVMEGNDCKISEEAQQDMECDNSTEKVDEKNAEKLNSEKQYDNNEISKIEKINLDKVAEIEKLYSESKSDEAEIAVAIGENEKVVADTEVVKLSEESTQVDLKSMNKPDRRMPIDETSSEVKDKNSLDAQNSTDIFDILLPTEKKNEENGASDKSDNDDDITEIPLTNVKVDSNLKMVNESEKDVPSDDEIEEILVKAANKSAKSSEVQNEICLEPVDLNESDIDEDEEETAPPISAKDKPAEKENKKQDEIILDDDDCRIEEDVVNYDEAVKEINKIAADQKTLMEETHSEGSGKKRSNDGNSISPVVKKMKTHETSELLNGQIKSNPAVNGLSSKMLKRIKKMSRRSLEQFCVEQTVQGIHNKSELAELGRKDETNKNTLENQKQQIESLKKQLYNMQNVIKKYLVDRTLPGPKTGVQKITRSVGLQVVMSNSGVVPYRGAPRGRGGRALQPRPSGGAVRPPLPSPPVRPVNPSPRPVVNPTQPLNNMISRPLTVNRVNQASTSPKPSGKAQPEIVELDLSDDESPSPSSNRPPPTLTRPVVKTKVNTPGFGALPLNRHPAPLPNAPRVLMIPGLKSQPPRPNLTIRQGSEGVVLSWTMGLNLLDHEPVSQYHIYAYQEILGQRPDQSLWKKVGNVKALPLPMACTLKQFAPGNRYHFAVRASDTHGRHGLFSDPHSIQN